MEQLTEQLIKTGTTGIAFLFKDGILIAADKRISAEYIVGKNIEKVRMISKSIGIAISGLVSDAVNLADIMKAELKLFKFDNGYEPSVKVAASLLGAICHSGYRGFQPYWVQLLVGGFDETGSHLYTVDPSGAVTPDNYAVIGSGSLFALSKIEDEWKENMTKEQARDLGIKALKLAMSRDLYTGDGIDLFFITKDGMEHTTLIFKDTEEV